MSWHAPPRPALQDGVIGLLHQVQASLAKRHIQRLTRSYLALPLAVRGGGSRGGEAGEAGAESALRRAASRHFVPLRITSHGFRI